MDGYESMYDANNRRAAEAKAKRAIDDAEYEKEEAERVAQRSRRQAEEATRQAARERSARQEEANDYEYELEARQERIDKLEKEKAIVVNALRPLVELLNKQPPSSLNYFIGAPLSKAVREAAELLSVIDGLHKPPTTPT